MGIVLLLLSIFNSKIRSNYYNSYKQIFKLLKLSYDIKNSNKKVLMFHAASTGDSTFQVRKQLLAEPLLEKGASRDLTPLTVALALLESYQQTTALLSQIDL